MSEETTEPEALDAPELPSPPQPAPAPLVCRVCGCTPEAPCIEDEYFDGSSEPTEVHCVLGPELLCSRCAKPGAFIVTPATLLPPPPPPEDEPAPIEVVDTFDELEPAHPAPEGETTPEQ